MATFTLYLVLYTEKKVEPKWLHPGAVLERLHPGAISAPLFSFSVWNIRCHTKRRADAAMRTNPSFGMTTPLQRLRTKGTFFA